VWQHSSWQYHSVYWSRSKLLIFIACILLILLLQVKPVKPLTIEKKIGGEKNGETRTVLLKKRRNYYPTADKYELNIYSSVKFLWLLHELLPEYVNLCYIKGILLLSCFYICWHSQRRYLNEGKTLKLCRMCHGWLLLFCYCMLWLIFFTCLHFYMCGHCSIVWTFWL
jgi:hypothetical protein